MSISVVVAMADLTRNGGGERYCLELASALQGAGYQVTVVTGRFDPNACYPELTVSLQINSLGRSPIRTPLNRLNEVLDAIWVGLRCAVPNDSVVVPHGWPAHWTALALKVRHGARAVWACNDFMFSPAAMGASRGRVGRFKWWAMLALDRLAARRMDVVMVLSEYAKAQVDAGYGVTAEVVRPTFAYMYRDVPRWIRGPHEPARILGLNILMPHRGVEDVVRAVALLRDRAVPVRYTHVGGTDHTGYRAVLDRLVAELDLGEHVSFAGVVSEERRIDLMDQSDVFVFTPSEQTYGLAVLEAVGGGLPTIVASGSGIAEVVDLADAGLVYRAGDPADLADKIHVLLSDDSRREHLGEAGHRLAAKCGWETALSQWEANISAPQAPRA